MNLSTILRRSTYWSTHSVVRWQLLLMVAVVWLAGLWLKSNYGEEDSNLWLVMRQFIILLQGTLISLFALSLLFTLAMWVLFRQKVKSKKVLVHMKLGEGRMAEAGFVPLVIQLSGFIVRPLLGTVRARLIFIDKKMSDVILLDENITGSKGWQRLGIRGVGKAMLHDRGIYDVENVLVHFSDMFGLIALPVLVPVVQQLYTIPKAMKDTDVKALPNATEEQKHRIEIPKKVEGEYVNYKEFEAGDNIQRIVWKIYAKSGQLVVRIPETKDPYASHFYFYASYYDGFSAGTGIFGSEILNSYKDNVRSLFEALQRNGYDVRLPQDQEVPKLSGMGDKKTELFQITAAHWQDQNPPSAFVKGGKAAFICLSSLTPVSEMEVMLRNVPSATPVAVVRASQAIRSPFKISVSDIFFRPEEHPSDKLKQPWLLSPLRQKLSKNEQEIETLLKQRGNGWLINTIQLE